MRRRGRVYKGESRVVDRWLRRGAVAVELRICGGLRARKKGMRRRGRVYKGERRVVDR
jgi:hypothetical protein